MSCLTVFNAKFFLLWQGSGILLTALCLYDYWQTRVLATPSVTRIMPDNLPMSATSVIRLQIQNPLHHPLTCLIHDLYPSVFEISDLPQLHSIPAQKTISLEYRVTPPGRGDKVFTGTELQLFSLYGLWKQRRVIDNSQTVRVYPNFAEMTRYTLLATENRLSRIGIKQRQRRGQGNEFLHLRAFHESDSQRQIHWQASAKYQKLIAKDYQDEKDQQVILLLDCGRRMRHQDRNRAQLDEALNAALLLAYVAVRQGDAVGMLTMGGDNRWLAPRKGQKRVNHLLNTLYDLEATPHPADYMTAAMHLNTVQNRRALVIVVTNTRNQDHQQLAQAIKQLQRSHLVVLADLREQILDEALQRDIENSDDALLFSELHQYLTARKHYHALLRHQGIATLDITARQLPAALVNRYLDIKAGSVL